MTTKLPTGTILILCFLGSVLAQGDSICSYDCVATDVYGPFCGGADCVSGASNEAQRERLCSEECSGAILGSPMRDCVLSRNPNIPNLDSEQQNLVTSIRVFCDHLEPSTTPESAPASEPLTPSSEAPISADAPDSAGTPDSADAPDLSIPIDPPEIAPLSEEIEPSMAAEPSVEAPFSEPVEAPFSEPVEAPFSEPVEAPETMDSAIAPMSDGSPGEDILEEEEEETIGALDLF